MMNFFLSPLAHRKKGACLAQVNWQCSNITISGALPNERALLAAAQNKPQNDFQRFTGQEGSRHKARLSDALNSRLARA